jgi:DNA modification methylase
METLRPNSRNARTHPKKQIRQLADSIQQCGVLVPPIVDENNVVLAGAARVLAAKALGREKIAVLVVRGLNEAQKRAYALADNKIAASAGWDSLLLAAEIGELGELLPKFNMSLEATGFEPPEIDGLLGNLSDPEHDPIDQVPPVAPHAVSRFGDLWHLGVHRLHCGDALSASDFKKLMNQQRAAMVITDPPYNVSIKKIVGRGRTKHSEFQQGSGEMTPPQFAAFLHRSMSLTAKYTIEGAPAFWCMDWRHQKEILEAGLNAYPEMLNLVVWVKTNGGQGSLYRSAHELIFVFKTTPGNHLNNVQLGKFGRNRTNVWSYPGVNTFREGRLEDLRAHPTVKPVAMIADAMRDCSRRGDIVLDPFLGSGTTIVAAEQVGRRAFGLEIGPIYADVAIRRWQQLTKRDAVLESTGETFDDLSIARSRSRSGA